MLRLIAVALALIAGPAWAEAQFNGDVAARLWYTAHRLCYEMEDYFGQTVSDEVSKSACEYREDLGSDLIANGWCFDRSEQEWASKCPVVPAPSK